MRLIAKQKAAISFWSGALLTAVSLCAVPEGTILLPSAEARTLVEAGRYKLRPTELRPEVEVVIFYYCASWCGPCKQASKALRASYPKLIANEPRLEVITYSVDRSVDARADYLRTEQFPWPAIAPELIGKPEWPQTVSSGTPSFQAFTISTQHWQAITPTGDAPTIFNKALTALHTN